MNDSQWQSWINNSNPMERMGAIAGTVIWGFAMIPVLGFFGLCALGQRGNQPQRGGSDGR
jgi:hypothetical protein